MPFVPIQYDGDTICITGIGALLPGANSCDSFWKNLVIGKNTLTRLCPSRWDKIIENSYNTFTKLHPFLNKVGVVADEYLNGVRGESRLEKICRKSLLEAIRQIDKSFWYQKRTFVSLGCMSFDDFSCRNDLFFNIDEVMGFYSPKNPSEFTNFRKFALSIKKSECEKSPKSIISSVFEDELNTSCDGVIIDAACASSLLAISVGMNKLKNNEADVVISGGMESDLGPASFISFQKLGVLSKGLSLPFDARSDGMTQGEGAVILILERLEDALIEGHEIFGVIGYDNFLSSGKKASLISPSLETLKELILKAQNSMSKMDIDFIECHGTGTIEGDKAELLALSQTLKKETPIGSVKSLIGHTKGTAGAAGILKCLLSIKNRVIPPSPYFEQMTIPVKNLFVNTKQLLIKKDKPLLFLVLSAGFGGINGVISIQEYVPWLVKPFKNKEQKKIVVCGYGFASLDVQRKSFLDSFTRIPISTINSIDITQLVSIKAAKEAIERSALNLSISTKISVISAADMNLDIRKKIAMKLQGNYLIKIFSAEGFDISKEVTKIQALIPDITEDTATGSLSSMIAGRICHLLDIHGKHYNVDSTKNHVSAMGLAINELTLETSEMVILVLIDKTLRLINCLCLSLKDTAKKRNWPCLFEVEKL